MIEILDSEVRDLSVTLRLGENMVTVTRMPDDELGHYLRDHDSWEGKDRIEFVGGPPEPKTDEKEITNRKSLFKKVGIAYYILTWFFGLPQERGDYYKFTGKFYLKYKGHVFALDDWHADSIGISTPDDDVPAKEDLDEFKRILEYLINESLDYLCTEILNAM